MTTKVKLSFEQWMDKVDQLVSMASGGFETSDFPDICYYDMWEAGNSPVTAAKECLENF